MNTIKKIGLTALGTTLVASSAFAGEISVSGDAGYTWSSESIGGATTTTTTGTKTEDGVGYNHDISFSGSGELDNGWTVSTGMTIVEDSSLSSSNVKLTMGSMGTITVGNGTGGVGASYDGVTPTAYEENHDGMKTSTAVDNIGALLGNGGIDYSSPSFDLGGTGATASFKYNYTPEASGSAVGEGGVSTNHATWASGQALGIDISYGGLSVGAFGAEVHRDSLGAVAATTTGTKDGDAFDGTWYAKWTSGPVSIGYQTASIDRGASGDASATTTSAKYVTTASGNFDSEMMSIAFNVNENLSFSWSELEETYDDQSNTASGTETADVVMESTSIQFAYTMGSMSIKGYQTDTDNPGWDSDAQSDEITELAINFAF
jgi:outer membrane protein OmpU